LGVALVVARAAVADDTPAERKAHLAQLDDEEKEQLSQNFERFRRLDPAQQDRLRRLHGELESSAGKDALQKVMQNYHEWLKGLSAAQRAELASLAPEERLEKIDDIRAAQRRREGMRVSPQDMEKIEAWVQKHRQLRGLWGGFRRGGQLTQ